MIVYIKRIILLLGIVCLPIETVFSQHSSKNNYTGAWETPTSWSPTWPAPQTTINPYDITINGYITVNSSLSFSGTSDLIINDTLVINGDLSLNDNCDLTINNNAILIVRGSVSFHNHSDIIANGYLIITGDVDKSGPFDEGSCTSNDNPNKVFIGGNISPVTITNNEPNFPAFNCTAPIPTRYPHSHCSHGDMTDLISDPIYPFFQSTCTATPIITAGGPTTFCSGGSLTLTSSAGATYLWSTGATTSSINITVSGSYTVKVTNASGCLSAASAATIVTVNALPAMPTITAGGPTTFCAGGSVTLTSSPEATYLWSNGATTQSINITTAGSYSLRVKNASGCQSATSVATIVTVNVLPATPTITAGGPITFCAGGDVTLTSSAGTSYLWSNGATTPSINVTTLGSYTVQVKNASGCQSAASAATLVTVNTLPITPTITASGPTTFCTGGSVTLTSSAGSTYLWSTGTTTSNINVTTAGSYTVKVKNANECQSAASTTTIVVVNEKPVAFAGPDQNLKFNFETQMNAELSASESGEWSLISGSGHISDIHSPTTRITELSIGENKYLWKVLNASCEDTAEVKITVHDLFVPSVITPNGDGKNDYFKISESSGKVELIIFNRWGNEEYSSNNYLNDWDGRNNKRSKLPEDTYFYILKFENGKILKGSVLIKR
jgi:gliding motility-associated-like protein